MTKRKTNTEEIKKIPKERFLLNRNVKKIVNFNAESKIKIEGIKDEIDVNYFLYKEEISELTELKISFYDLTNVIKSEIINKEVEISFTVKDSINHYDVSFRSRIFYGYISESSCELIIKGNLEYKLYSLKINSFFEKLKNSKKRKIYQKKTCVEIAEEIFKNRKFNDFKMNLKNKNNYKKNEYITQYDETDLDFILRIFEQDGIYFFISNNEKEKKQEVIFFDNDSIFKLLKNGELYPTPTFTTENNFNQLYLPKEREQKVIDSILIHSYNYKIPKTDLTQKKKGKMEEFESTFEENYADISQGEKILTSIFNAKVLQERILKFLLRRPIKICDKFKIKSDKYKTFENEYIVNKCEVLFENKRIYTEINCFPSECDFSLPKKYSKPMVHGAQLALVVGNENDHVLVGKMATIRIQFYWDLYGIKNADSSNDIRVAQLFGGKSGSKGNSGSWFIPRVGQEVLVHFINADPDQPVIMGCLYNGANPSPFDGKESSEGFTKSGITTCTIPDGEKGHEFIFDDKKDEEKILMSSTRDFELIVANDTNFNISKNYKVDIEEGNYNFEIKKGDRSIVLKEGNYSINIEKGSLTIKTSDDISISTKGNIKFEAEKSIKMKANSIEIKSDTDIAIDASSSLSAKAKDISSTSSTSTTIKANTGLQLSGGTSANMKAPDVALEGNLKFEITGAIGKVQATGPLEIKGAITKLN